MVELGIRSYSEILDMDARDLALFYGYFEMERKDRERRGNR